MRVVLIGQAVFAQRVLDGLRERGREVVAVYCPPDPPSGKADPVKSGALEHGIPVRQHRTLKSPEALDEFAKLSVDLGVLAYVTQIVPAGVFGSPRLGSICFHPSLLPMYRGGSAIAWQIIKGETRTGVTVFWTDAGIDTGPILLQKEASIGPDDTAGSLYYDHLFPLGVAAVLEAVDLIDAGRAPRTPQDVAKGSYDPLCRDEHACVDWQRAVGEVYNLIRGCDPQPGAHVSRGGIELRFYDARRSERADVAPGLIGSIDESGVLIGARGGAILIGRMRAGDKKVAAHQAAAALGLKVGEPI